MRKIELLEHIFYNILLISCLSSPVTPHQLRLLPGTPIRLQR